MNDNLFIEVLNESQTLNQAKKIICDYYKCLGLLLSLETDKQAIMLRTLKEKCNNLK